MQWSSILNEVIDYIEEHLRHDISNDKIEKITCTSYYNFQRVFVFVFNMTVAEYIRYRRMTLAALDILEQNKRILDIAIDYGYQSSESFSRAFQQFHGILPSETKSKEYALRYCSRAIIETDIRAAVEVGYLKDIGTKYILNDFSIKESETIPLNTLVLQGVAHQVKGNDGVALTCEDDTAALYTPKKYVLPLFIEVEAKTNKTNLRLIYHQGDIHFNWQYKDWIYKLDEFIIHDIGTGACFGYPDKGRIEVDTFHKINWIIAKGYMAVRLDGKLLYYNEYLPYIKDMEKGQEIPAAPVGIASSWGSTVTIRNIQISQLNENQK